MSVQNSKLFLILPQEIKYSALNRLLFELARIITGDQAFILFYFFKKSLFYCYYSCYTNLISYVWDKSPC